MELHTIIVNWRYYYSEYVLHDVLSTVKVNIYMMMFNV
jgi:hypothetical protein